MVKKYPMSYTEYKQRVSELFLALANSPSEIEDMKLFLIEEEEIIRGEYNSACSNYDNPKRLNDSFTDFRIKHQPVRILEMLY